MIYVIDTEFAERPGSIELISIGIAAEDGRTYYAENAEFSGECNDWVRENVLPKLTGRSASISVIADEILAFVSGDDHPEFWAYYGDYDWVVFCWLFGSMVDLPTGWPMLCMDIQQEWLMAGQPPKPPEPSDEHNALADALWGLELLNEFHVMIHPRIYQYG